jgi:DNA repair exonuclease SbcCD ATPase subunit
VDKVDIDLSQLDEELSRDKKIILAGGLEAFHHILAKLIATAEEMQRQYDTIDFAREPEKAIRIQMYRRIVMQEIPRMIENIMNHDRPEDRGRFKFWTWLKTRLALTSGAE